MPQEMKVTMPIFKFKIPSWKLNTVRKKIKLYGDEAQITDTWDLDSLIDNTPGAYEQLGLTKKDLDSIYSNGYDDFAIKCIKHPKEPISLNYSDLLGEYEIYFTYDVPNKDVFICIEAWTLDEAEECLNNLPKKKLKSYGLSDDDIDNYKETYELVKEPVHNVSGAKVVPCPIEKTSKKSKKK